MCPYLSGVNYESVADGPGVRAAIFLSGCNHFCPGCHNPDTHDPMYGQPIDSAVLETIASNIESKSYISGITLTGGDPLYNPRYTYNFVRALRHRLWRTWSNYSIWLYTGYTWEQIVARMQKDTHLRLLISMCNVVVDGMFVQTLADKTLAFRGSSNQRLIDVSQSLKQGHPVLWDGIS